MGYRVATSWAPGAAVSGALSLLFVDISLQRSLEAKNVNISLWTGFAMTMAAAIESRTAEAGAWSAASRIAGVDIVRDLGAAEAVWRGLETQFSTPYQRFDFLASWQRKVGERNDLSPFIVIAHDAE